MGPLLPRSTDIPGLKGFRPPSHPVEFFMHGWVGKGFLDDICIPCLRDFPCIRIALGVVPKVLHSENVIPLRT